MGKYRTTPLQSTKLPRGIPYIIGNEAAERFSFYGMKGILTVFMTQHLMDSAGQPDLMNAEEAKTVYHLFTAAAYFFPIIGSLISDILWGKYKTIIILSLGYCVGHACLALGDTGTGTQVFEPRIWLFIGLIFIACGAGGIKPCVSAHVGDQFGQQNQHLVSQIFSWFYFSINVGTMASILLTPVILENDPQGAWAQLGLPGGPWVAFGLPGVLMAIATFVFWLGRHKFIHVPPGGSKKFIAETFSPQGRRALRNLIPIFLIFIPMFWAIFDQSGSAWVIQANSMNRHFLGMEWLEAQAQAVNPILILILIPTFAYAVYPAINKYFTMTPLRKISIGLFITVLAFAISGWIEMRIQAGGQPNIGWQFLAYIVLTAAEVLVSITSLEFAYTQAPKKMKSFIMGIYFLGISLGNAFTAAVNYFIQNEDGTTKLEGASYYWFFTILIAITAVAFVFYAMRYKGKTFVQGEDAAEEPADA